MKLQTILNPMLTTMLMELEDKNLLIYPQTLRIKDRVFLSRLISSKSMDLLTVKCLYLLISTYRKQEPKSNFILNTIFFKAPMMIKVNVSNRKEWLQKHSLKMDMACKLSEIIWDLQCKFLLIFRDGGTYNRAITTIIRDSYKKIEDFLSKTCNIKIHCLTSTQFSLIKTPLVHCRNILKP